MIQLAGVAAKKTYHIKEININVSSLEEINYFVYNHMNLVYRDFFCEELFDYIEKDLERKDLSDQLRIMERAGAGLKDLISYLLRESYYYDAADLSRISALVTSMDSITDAGRLKIEGDSLFKERKYCAARSAYLKILNASSETLKGEFFADIAFSAGLCQANLFLCKSACAYFNRAYSIFPKADYARACVYISIILEDEEELLKAIIKYKISDEVLGEIRKNIAKTKREVISGKGFAEFTGYISEREHALSLSADHKDEYYRMTE